MRHDSSPKAGSLDMLLDTMCNTFGGVCFIALMIAIISSSLPSKQDAEETADEVTEQMVVDKEMARLKRERDELKSAIEIQKSFVATNSTKESRAFSAAQLATHIASNTTALAKLKSEKLELEDKLAKTTTDSEYSRREAQRLERLLKEMEERLGQPANMKYRAVRTPVESHWMFGFATDVCIVCITNRMSIARCLKDLRASSGNIESSPEEVI